MELGLKEFCLAVNMVKNETHGKEIFSRFNQIMRRFYDVNITYVGSVPQNNKIKRSVIQKKPIILDKNNKEFYFLFEKMRKNINQAPINSFDGIKFFNNLLAKQ